MADAYLYTMSFSLIINFGLILFLKFTGIGQDCWQRWSWKRKFKNGNYAYSLLLNNSGKLEEVFKPVEKGLITYENGKYVRNPKQTILYRGLPAHFHREGRPEPIDPFECFDQDSDALSIQELDNIMNAETNFDIVEWFEKNKLIILGTIGLLVILSVLGVYFGYQSLEIVEGLYNNAQTLQPRG